MAKVRNNKLVQDSGGRGKVTRGRWLGSGTIGETMCTCLHEQAGKARAVLDWDIFCKTIETAAGQFSMTLQHHWMKE